MIIIKDSRGTNKTDVSRVRVVRSAASILTDVKTSDKTCTIAKHNRMIPGIEYSFCAGFVRECLFCSIGYLYSLSKFKVITLLMPRQSYFNSYVWH
jgi:hypothetical protein